MLSGTFMKIAACASMLSTVKEMLYGKSSYFLFFMGNALADYCFLVTLTNQFLLLLLSVFSDDDFKQKGESTMSSHS